MGHLLEKLHLPFFLEIWVVTRLVFILVFIFLITPLAAHVLSRAAYRSGLPVAPSSKVDEFRGNAGR